jgi:hypothetical protein
MIEMLAESEDEAIEREPYPEHCTELLYDFASRDSETISPHNFSADQNGSISLKYFREVRIFPRIAESFQKVIPRTLSLVVWR